MKFKSKKIISLIGAAAIAAGIFGGMIGNTWTIVVDWSATKPNKYTEIEVGASKTQGISSGSITTVTDALGGRYGNTVANKNNTFTVFGVTAGATSVTINTKQGYASIFNYQIVNKALMESYSFKFRGAPGIYMESGASNKLSTKKVSDIVTTTPSDALTQAESHTSWRSSNESAVTVDADGNLTAVATGAAIINANFTDKYGENQSLSYLVSVNTNINSAIIGPDRNGDYWKPLQPAGVYEHVTADGGHSSTKPEYIYTTDGDPTNLSTPVTKGEDGSYYTQVTPNVWEKLTDKGPDKLKPIWGGADGKPGNGDDQKAVPVGNGKYYTENAENIWTQVKPDGTLDTANPIYGGDDKLPSGNDNAPAKKGDNGSYWVEDISLPSGGHSTKNVWIPVTNGVIKPDNAVHGGADRIPGNGDDIPVKAYGNQLWANRGENIYQQIIPASGAFGALTGGGSDLDPSTNGLTNVLDNKLIDGHYYIGPYTDADNTAHYIGDSFLHASNKDGLINTEDPANVHKTDSVYYRNADGTMTLSKPAPASILAASCKISPEVALEVETGKDGTLTVVPTPSNTTEVPAWSNVSPGVPTFAVSSLSGNTCTVKGTLIGTNMIMAKYNNCTSTRVIRVFGIIHYQSNGGSDVADEKIYGLNSKITEPAAPTKDGYSFEGWYSDSGLTNRWNFDNTAETSRTLYAKWTKANAVIGNRPESDIKDWVVLKTETDSNGNKCALVTTLYLQDNPTVWTDDERKAAAYPTNVTTNEVYQYAVSIPKVTNLPGWFSIHTREKYITASYWANGSSGTIKGIPVGSTCLSSCRTSSDSMQLYSVPVVTGQLDISYYFLPGRSEINTYLNGTQYAAAKVKGASTNSPWWTRTVDESSGQLGVIYYVNAQGNLTSGDYTNSYYLRPAMWIQYE